MKNWITSVISVFAIIISIIAIANVAPTKGVDFDYWGAIIGVLAFLVTLLMGYQIYTVINVKEELREVQKERTALNLTVKSKMDEVKEQFKNDVSNLLPILIAIDTNDISNMIATAMRVHQEAETDSIAEKFSDEVILSFLNKGVSEEANGNEKYCIRLAKNLERESVVNYYAYFMRKNMEERNVHPDIEKILVKLICVLGGNKESES